MSTPTKNAIIGQFVNGRNAQDDFLQLATNHGGTVFAWIDYQGFLQGTFASGITADVQYINPTLSNVPSLSVSQVGATGSTSYTYLVFAVLGNLSLVPSPIATTTSGNATLNGSNFNRLTWTAVTGATSYNVYRTSSSGTPGTTGTIASNITTLTLNDTGLAVIDANNPVPFPGFEWSQNGYVGIQNGLQVGVPWTSITSAPITPSASDTVFNGSATGFIAQINAITYPESTTNYVQGALSILSDGYTNYLNNVLGGNTYGAVVNTILRTNPSSPNNTSTGLQSNLTVQVDSGITATATSEAVDVVLVTQGQGSHSGSEGVFGILTSHVNALVGTLSNASGVIAELHGETGAGEITNYHFFNINQFDFNGGTVANVYGFYNHMSFVAATNFSAAFYTTDQGTSSKNYSFYSVGGNNYFGGAAANSTKLINTSAATNILNQDSPSALFSGQAWSTIGGAHSETTVFYIKNKDGGLQFGQSSGTSPLQYPIIFNTQVQFNNLVLLSTINTGFATGNQGAVYTVTAAANASGSTTTYTVNTIGPAGQPAIGQNITIAGFVSHVSNNGYFVVAPGGDSTHIVVYNSSGVAETHAATATLDVNYDSSIGSYALQAGVLSSSNFPISGTSYVPSNAFNAYPNSPLFVMTAKGDVTDAGYTRIINLGGSSAVHGLEIGAIYDGTGANPVTLQMGYISGGPAALFNSSLITSATVGVNSVFVAAAQIATDTLVRPNVVQANFGGGVNYTNLRAALSANVHQESTGTVALAAAFIAETFTDIGSGVVADMRGVYVPSPIIAGAGITLQGGLVVDDQHITGVTTSYGLHILAQTAGGTAIKTEGTAPSTFGGIVTAPTLIESTTHTPSSATDTGTTGQIAWDTGFIYICTATNTWKRVAIAGGF